MDHLLLIDGHHLMYRAFYAVPQTMQTRAGELTNVPYGVASMLLNMLKTEEPTHLLFCFDAGEETFRHKEHAAYKEGRAETPDIFYTQIPRVTEFLESFDISHVSNPTLEADDLLGAYARAGEAAGMRVTIVTGDRDALQLATSAIRIAIPHKGYLAPEYLGPHEIVAKYGIRPDQVPAYKGLCGDSSDNLPGVKGIGPKGASALLQEHETLEGVYAHLDLVKPALREKLERDREQAFFCERMARLVTDIPLPVSLSDSALTQVQTSGVLGFFDLLEFTSLKKRLQSLCLSPYGRNHFLWQDAQVTPSSQSASQMALF